MATYKPFGELSQEQQEVFGTEEKYKSFMDANAMQPTTTQ